MTVLWKKNGGGGSQLVAARLRRAARPRRAQNFATSGFHFIEARLQLRYLLTLIQARGLGRERAGRS